MTAIMPEYGTTADGLRAARVGDLAYIAVPVSEGFRLASGWRVSRPIGEWSKADTCGSEGVVTDEAGAESIAVHLAQRSALGRREVRMRLSTPWGMSQGATIYAEGIVSHSTASHGGFKLDRRRNAALHPALRIAGGWYEEDGDWARVATGYPEVFTDRERAQAERTLRDWEPDAWEAVHGRALGSEESSPATSSTSDASMPPIGWSSPPCARLSIPASSKRSRASVAAARRTNGAGSSCRTANTRWVVTGS